MPARALQRSQHGPLPCEAHAAWRRAAQSAADASSPTCYVCQRVFEAGHHPHCMVDCRAAGHHPHLLAAGVAPGVHNHHIMRLRQARSGARECAWSLWGLAEDQGACCTSTSSTSASPGTVHPTFCPALRTSKFSAQRSTAPMFAGVLGDTRTTRTPSSSRPGTVALAGCGGLAAWRGASDAAAPAASTSRGRRRSASQPRLATGRGRRRDTAAQAR